MKEIQRAIDALKLVPREYVSLVLSEAAGGKRRGRKPGPRPGSKRKAGSAKPGPKPKQKPGPKPGSKRKVEKAPVKMSSEKAEKLARLKAKGLVSE